ncbi:Bifunctional enzyme IspD/IspF [Jannaschia seosinensis]|uniref:Bifunctional enzyme IspD/IspF n=1 Tax=Jannaschia seosinensis TaxID=313367 RepID=A0A0M7BF72_9RHOB|nr:bifunctional 2-C-methyl-D-erythritol 4-phosphate cytidylyltransferase/2-C-methyl-D-erythritol 2,4-cyclodiphosphate synthase [Jannaschia seosinensis]CUH40432.1 Bifunctional enzyme IspD/IspF [Jannaschia seosinensis]
MEPSQLTALIVAAGRGTRAGGEIPKQYRNLRGVPMISLTIAAFADRVADMVVAVHPDDEDLARAAAPDAHLVAGGATRSASVRAGLAAVTTPFVLIHDAARPGVTGAVIDRVTGALRNHDGAAPALPVVDALWEGETTVTGTRDRSGLWRAQTPQGFRADAIRAAHEAHPGEAADDVEVARAAGLDVAIVAGDERNMKITGPDDFARFERGLGMDVRVGNGFDVHRFGDGDHVMLCGVAVPHSHGLDGHSDADVGLHTLTDAIYGALAEGDIGRHFPPSDPQWKGTDSSVFLAHAVGLAREKGFELSNLDATLICEFPKVGPHADAMRARVAEIVGIGIDRVSIKATTTERLGFPGRGEGIACTATATLVSA